MAKVIGAKVESLEVVDFQKKTAQMAVSENEDSFYPKATLEKIMNDSLLLPEHKSVLYLAILGNPFYQS